MTPGGVREPTCRILSELEPAAVRWEGPEPEQKSRFASACSNRSGVLARYRLVVVMFAYPRKSRTCMIGRP